jgi:hypothetical protein
LGSEDLMDGVVMSGERSYSECDDSAQQAFAVNVMKCPSNLKCVNFPAVKKYD